MHCFALLNASFSDNKMYSQSFMLSVIFTSGVMHLCLASASFYGNESFSKYYSDGRDAKWDKRIFPKEMIFSEIPLRGPYSL